MVSRACSSAGNASWRAGWLRGSSPCIGRLPCDGELHLGIVRMELRQAGQQIVDQESCPRTAVLPSHVLWSACICAASLQSLVRSAVEDCCDRQFSPGVGQLSGRNQTSIDMCGRITRQGEAKTPEIGAGCGFD